MRSLAIDPRDFQRIYVIDFLNKVWASFDQGASWIDLTANLVSLSSDIRAIEVVRLEASKHTVLIVGGLGGVFQRKLKTERDGEDENEGEDDGWHALGKRLPPAFVRDLHYNSANDVLVAATLGRGAWTLPNIFRGDDGKFTLQQVEARSTLADTRAVEASSTEGGELDLDAELVPPIAVLLAEDE